MPTFTNCFFFHWIHVQVRWKALSADFRKRSQTGRATAIYLSLLILSFINTHPHGFIMSGQRWLRNNKRFKSRSVNTDETQRKQVDTQTWKHTHKLLKHLLFHHQDLSRRLTNSHITLLHFSLLLSFTSSLTPSPSLYSEVSRHPVSLVHCKVSKPWCCAQKKVIIQ